MARLTKNIEVSYSFASTNYSHPEETASRNILSPQKATDVSRPEDEAQKNASRVFDDAFFGGRDKSCALSGGE